MTIGVEAQSRQHGIGAMVLKKIVLGLYQSGCRTIYLHVKSDNSVAIQFYNKKGFKKTAFKCAYYYIDDKKHDAYELTLDIPENKKIVTEDDLDMVMQPVELNTFINQSQDTTVALIAAFMLSLSLLVILLSIY